MRALSALRVAVVGGGVLGLSIAARCARDGARVTVFEARAVGDNASGVAAGMLAPGLETVLEQGAPALPRLLLQAYEAWPAFLGALGVDPPPDLASGALYVGLASEVDAVSVRLRTHGFAACGLGVEEARRRQPGLAPAFDAALSVSQDGRLDAMATLRALQAVVSARGGDIRRERLAPQRLASERLALQGLRGFDAVVLALGAESRAWGSLAPELASLQPIKGHVLHFAGGPRGGPVVRSLAGYAAPQQAGVIFGATMEAGRSDLELDAAIVAQLHARAAALIPELAHVAFTARTGVRVSTPDGAPLVGRTASGLFVAVGARRNGWLLAPLVADAMAAALQGASPLPEFDPARFQHTAALANA